MQYFIEKFINKIIQRENNSKLRFQFGKQYSKKTDDQILLFLIYIYFFLLLLHKYCIISQSVHISYRSNWLIQVVGKLFKLFKLNGQILLWYWGFHLNFQSCLSISRIITRYTVQSWTSGVVAREAGCCIKGPGVRIPGKA